MQWAISIKNLVCLTDLKCKLDLNTLAIKLGLENIEYEPEQFPGLVYRPPERKGVYLMFGSGKVVITGLSNFGEVEEAGEKLRDEIDAIV